MFLLAGHCGLSAVIGADSWGCCTVKRRWLTCSRLLTWSMRFPRRATVRRMTVRSWRVHDRGEASSRSTIGYLNFNYIYIHFCMK
jgi:hypothetical protein